MKNIINTYHKTLSFSDIKTNIQAGEILNIPDSIANYMLGNPFIKLIKTSKKNSNKQVKSRIASKPRIKKKG